MKLLLSKRAAQTIFFLVKTIWPAVKEGQHKSNSSDMLVPVFDDDHDNILTRFYCFLSCVSVRKDKVWVKTTSLRVRSPFSLFRHAWNFTQELGKKIQSAVIIITRMIMMTDYCKWWWIRIFLWGDDDNDNKVREEKDKLFETVHIQERARETETIQFDIKRLSAKMQ